jgi:hypothetical protein
MLLQLPKVSQEQALSSSNKGKKPTSDASSPARPKTTVDSGGSGVFSPAILSAYLGFSPLKEETDIIEAAIGIDWLSDLKAFSNLFGKDLADPMLVRMKDVPVDSTYFLEQTEEDTLEGLASF